MNKTIVALAMFITSASVCAQNRKTDTEYKKGFTKAIDLLFQEEYDKALPILLHLDSIKDNANLQFYIGYCYLMSPFEKAKAIAYLEYAAKHTTPDYTEGDYKEEEAPPYAAISLGDAYHLNYMFDKAISSYENYRSILHESQKKEINEIDRKIEICNNARNLVASPVPMTTSNLGAAINSAAPDYSPVITADESEIIFTSRKEGSTGGLRDEDGYQFEDIYISEKKDNTWTQPVKIGASINSDGHEAPTGLAADGQMLLIYKFSATDGGDIYFSKRTGDTWSEPLRFADGINTPAWESHATISADGRFLSFTSNREGGIGGRDIYFCKRLPTGDWAMPQNFGPTINTPYDEGSPFLHPDGKTLFFSSKGHNTMGGFDIFYSVKREDGSWSEPVNLGYPVNTTGDDTYYMPTTDGKSAYYASFRQDGMGEKDIYKITLPQMEEKKLTVYKGTIRNTRGEVPEDIYIEVSDNETGELVGSYTPNSATGKYLFILTPGKNYNISYESENECYYHSENLIVPDETSYQVINKAVVLDPLTAGVLVRLNNIFYEYDKATLSKPESIVELDKLYDLMIKCPKLKVEIAGHTDSKGTDAYNIDLSQRRCQSVVDYLTDKGIEAKRMVAKGYGESQAVAPNQNPDGSDNPEGRALNRRTELRIL